MHGPRPCTHFTHTTALLRHSNSVGLTFIINWYNKFKTQVSSRLLFPTLCWDLYNNLVLHKKQKQTRKNSEIFYFKIKITNKQSFEMATDALYLSTHYYSFAFFPSGLASSPLSSPPLRSTPKSVLLPRINTTNKQLINPGFLQKLTVLYTTFRHNGLIVYVALHFDSARCWVCVLAFLGLLFFGFYKQNKQKKTTPTWLKTTFAIN